MQCRAIAITALPTSPRSPAVAHSQPKPSTTSSVDPIARPVLRQLPSQARSRQPQHKTNVDACRFPPSAYPAHLLPSQHPSLLVVAEAVSLLQAPIPSMKMRSMMTTVPLAAIPPRHSHAACHSVDKLSDLREALVAQAQLVKAVASTGLSSLDPVPRAPCRSLSALLSQPPRPLQRPHKCRCMREPRASARCLLLRSPSRHQHHRVRSGRSPMRSRSGS